MTSKDDDTMPLPGLSQEPSSDVTVDEDFIPASQPLSVGTKVSRNSDISFNKSSEDIASSHAISISRIDDTLPTEAIIEQTTLEKDKSADFIPDTETKTVKINYANQDLSCKKKLEVFGTEDTFRIHLNPTWDADVSRIPESPALDTQNFSIIKDSPTKTLSANHKTVHRSEESVTEIIVNDSAETVDLEVTPRKIIKLESAKTQEKQEICSSSNSDIDRYEETQIFDNSSVLLLDQPGSSRLDLGNTERISGTPSEKSYLQDTVDDNKENSQDGANHFGSPCHLTTSHPDYVKLETVDTDNRVQPKSVCTDSGNTSIVTRKMDFKLTVSCRITINTVTNKILQKAILDVSETTKPKAVNVEPGIDNMSDKSKRQSTSSSGSVYSDKTGLPFALPKRISVVSDQTDSSEEDFSVQMKKEMRMLQRMHWKNEYLLPLKMDDLMQVAIDKDKFMKKPMMSSPKKLKNKRCNGVNHLKEILESSSFSSTSLSDLPAGEPQSTKTNNAKEILRTEPTENSPPEVEKTDENIKGSFQVEVGSEVVQVTDKIKEPSENVHNPEPDFETEPEPQPELHLGCHADTSPKRPTEEQTRVEKETSSITLSDGLPVFARWTDKRYYSGVLSGNVKNERWNIKFDDGTSKVIREDLIMPSDWVKVGALVFAHVDDIYESGQIIDIKRGKEVDYIVELDTEKKEVSVKISDLCLTEVMAGIVREKYKPLSGTPRGKADIDFDNVLSGKRLREQRTPLKPIGTFGAGNSGLRKKSSKTKTPEEVCLESTKGTPQNNGAEIKIGGLKSDNGHLVEDKIISTDSHSGTETAETPLCGITKEAKIKERGRPRSLCYELKEIRSGKFNSGLAPDGTPIPGPSGIKPKKQKTKIKAEDPETKIDSAATRSSKKSPARTKVPQLNEKSKRKRKLDESFIESIQKKSFKEGRSKVKMKSRKG